LGLIGKPTARVKHEVADTFAEDGFLLAGGDASLPVGGQHEGVGLVIRPGGYPLAHQPGEAGSQQRVRRDGMAATKRPILDDGPAGCEIIAVKGIVENGAGVARAGGARDEQIRLHPVNAVVAHTGPAVDAPQPAGYLNEPRHMLCAKPAEHIGAFTPAREAADKFRRRIIKYPLPNIARDGVNLPQDFIPRHAIRGAGDAHHDDVQTRTGALKRCHHAAAGGRHRIKNRQRSSVG